MRRVTLLVAALALYLLQLERATLKAVHLCFSLPALQAVQQVLVVLWLLLVVLVVLAAHWICVPARAVLLAAMLCSRAVMCACLPVMARCLAGRLPLPLARTLQVEEALA